MTTKTRREFTDEFKREAVVLLQGGGPPLSQLASELGIQPSMLRAWRGRPMAATGPAVPGAVLAAPPTEQAEIRRLRREPERAQMERDIPTKAIGIFSDPPR